MAGAAITTVLANIMIKGPDGRTDIVYPWLARTLTGLLTGVGVYLLITFLILINLLRDAYARANRIEEAEARRDAA